MPCKFYIKYRKLVFGVTVCWNHSLKFGLEWCEHGLQTYLGPLTRWRKERVGWGIGSKCKVKSTDHWKENGLRSWISLLVLPVRGIFIFRKQVPVSLAILWLHECRSILWSFLLWLWMWMSPIAQWLHMPWMMDPLHLSWSLRKGGDGQLRV